jgi:hypothetical protein
VGGHRGAIEALHLPQLDFFRCGGGRQIVVEFPRLGPGNVPVGEAANHDLLLPAERPPDLDLVTDAHNPMWFRRLTVDVDLAVLAGFLRLGPRPEQAGDIEPHIETNLGRNQYVGIIHGNT